MPHAPTSLTHWGAFTAGIESGDIASVTPLDGDTDPSPLLGNLAGELRRVVDTHGNEAIYGGSYGWASAGRFHHAQSQVHRFLKLAGGYTFSRHSYSLG